VTDITDSAQKIAFAGHANDHARSLFPDALTRLLAPGHNSYLDATCACQGSRLVDLLLAEAARQEDEHPLRRDSLRASFTRALLVRNEGVRQAVLVDRQKPGPARKTPRSTVPESDERGTRRVCCAASQ